MNDQHLLCVHHGQQTQWHLVYWCYQLDLIRRVYEHKNNLIEGFTNKYRVHKLVYWEQSENIESALQREKQLKIWKRQWKLALIEEHNANWQDLYEQLL